jgi:hypothetical protein
MSWNFPPEEMLDAGYIPSLWSVQKISLMVLVSIILGPLSLPALIAAGPSVHRNIANAPRKRKPHVRYPVRALF